ncbi:hypothetical protein [Treponema sp.]|uniref:hypothetical protein n=1 Tax=Treponema sp. TaxID=166 RepID=UPI0038901C0F
MKLNKIKTVAIAATIAVLSAVPVFAQKTEGRKGPGFAGHHGPFNFAEKQIMGTISSVNLDSQTIVITDADGKNRKIHVNPLTKIALVEPRRTPPKAKKGDKKDKPEFPFIIEKLAIDNLKAGHWITVQKFNTDTETAEAWCINVHNFRAVGPALDTANAK